MPHRCSFLYDVKKIEAVKSLGRISVTFNRDDYIGIRVDTSEAFPTTAISFKGY